MLVGSTCHKGLKTLLRSAIPANCQPRVSTRRLELVVLSSLALGDELLERTLSLARVHLSLRTW